MKHAPAHPGLAWLVLVLMTQAAASARVNTEHDLTESGPKDLELEGVAHTTLKFFESYIEKDTKSIAGVPGEVFLMLKKHDLIQEYRSLMSQVALTERGRMGSWKASEVFRTMYVGGHDKAFEAKNVSIFLTKRDRFGVAKLKLWFVDRTVQPTYIPIKVYTDASKVWTGPHNKKVMPDGVVARTYDDLKIDSDKMTMPVGLLKLLEAKDAMLLHMNFAAEVKVKGRTWFMAALTAHDYQEQFIAKGLRVFFCQGESGGADLDFRKHAWLEYVDQDVAPNYTPPEVYGVDRIEAYKTCQNGGDPSAWYTFVAEGAMASTGSRAHAFSDECAYLVVGATSRTLSSFECKCKGDDESLFCGNQIVDGRKFSPLHVLKPVTCGVGGGGRCIDAFEGDANACALARGNPEICRHGSDMRKRCCVCGGGIRTTRASISNVAHCASKACSPPK